MANLSKQKEAMVGYFRAGCKPEGQLTVGLEVEHFLTHTDGAPAAFEEVQAAMLALQQSGDVPLVQDGETVGLRSSGYVLTLEPAAQLEISITPQKSVGALMAVMLWRAIRGLVWQSKQPKPDQSKRLFHLVMIGYIVLENGLWLSSYPWAGDTLANPYFWFDFAVTASILALFPAVRKAVRA